MGRAGVAAGAEGTLKDHSASALPAPWPVTTALTVWVPWLSIRLVKKASRVAVGPPTSTSMREPSRKTVIVPMGRVLLTLAAMITGVSPETAELGTGVRLVMEMAVSGV